MSWPSRLSSRNEPQKRWAGSSSRGARPHSSDRLAVDAQDLPVDVAGVDADRQRVEDRLVEIDEGFQEGRKERRVELEGKRHVGIPHIHSIH